MKVRNGFVSNSSSSSFVVEIRDSFTKARDPDTEDYLTPDEISKLLAFGFQYTYFHSPIAIEHAPINSWVCKPEDEAEADLLGYHDNINEDEKIYLLVKNNIPFRGVIHYGHNSVFYERDGKEVIFIRNHGLAISMYWSSDKRLQKINPDFSLEKQILGIPILQKIPKEEYLKEQEEFIKEEGKEL